MVEFVATFQNMRTYILRQYNAQLNEFIDGKDIFFTDRGWQWADSTNYLFIQQSYFLWRRLIQWQVRKFKTRYYDDDLIAKTFPIVADNLQCNKLFM